jgi:hypothetical protein
MVVVKSQGNLLQIAAALGPPGCFACLMNRRQNQSDQDSDDGNDH